MIHVIATVTVQDGQREAFLREFQKIVPLVRAEAGCVEYGPAVDVASGLALQGPARENVVVILEKWDSVDALRAHSAAPHMAEYRQHVKDLVKSVHLQVLAPA
jgi:quinol monooxygenase YgiN